MTNLPESVDYQEDSIMTSTQNPGKRGSQEFANSVNVGLRPGKRVLRRQRAWERHHSLGGSGIVSTQLIPYLEVTMSGHKQGT